MARKHLARQVLALSRLNLRTLPARAGTAAVAVVGIGGVVAVLVAALSITEGFRAALTLSGREDVGVILRGGSVDELSSGLPMEAVRHVLDAPGLPRDAQGVMASPELYVVVDVPKKGSGTPANVPLRGVGPGAFPIRGGFRMVQGRRFVPGLNEVIVGQGAAAQFEGLTVGSVVRFGGQPWTVTGIFADEGSVSESEIWTDATVLQGSYQRGTSYQSIRLRLPEASAMEALRRHLAADPRFTLSLRTEREFLQGQSGVLVTGVRTIGILIALVMGVGAVFASLNTMYAAVAARSREIATLRALGFQAPAVLVSVLAEALVLGLLGGCVGGALAFLAFNGFQASTLNFQSFSQITFAFTVTPTLLALGVGYALVLGLLGGLLPGLKAARQVISQGLREL